jgi:tetratricopeptide (TPR) repeat protein
MLSSHDRLLQQGTVKLVPNDSREWGTGFLVTPNFILTCAHVVEGHDVIPVWWRGQTWATAKVERILPLPVDLALLQLAPPEGEQPPWVLLSETFNPFDRLYIYGYPDDFPNGGAVTIQGEGDAQEQGVTLIKAQSSQGLSIARKNKYIEGEQIALNDLGLIHRDLGIDEKAIEYHQKSLIISRELSDSRREGYATANLGIAYQGLGFNGKAVEHLLEASTLIPEKDKRGAGELLYYLGFAHHSLDNNQEALKYFKESLRVIREINYRLGELEALTGLGKVHAALNDYETAFDCHQQALTIAQEIGVREGEGDVLINIGAIKLKLSEYLELLTSTKRAPEIFPEIDDRANEAEALKNLAELYQALGEVEVARQYCQQALILATELVIPLKAGCEALLQQIETSGGDNEI